MRITSIIITLLFICASPVYSKIYKWTDTEGVEHYTTTPPPQEKASHTYTTQKEEPFVSEFDKYKEHPAPQNPLQKRLEYLYEIPEIEWVEYKGNNVYLGFNRICDDIQMIVNAAAFNGNIAHGSGVHVWAIDAKDRFIFTLSRPYAHATVRYGKFED